MGQGASLGEEAVLADSGWAGEVAAGAGRVRRLAFLSILRGVLLLSQTYRAVKFRRAHRLFRSQLDSVSATTSGPTSLRPNHRAPRRGASSAMLGDGYLDWQAIP